MRVASVNLMAGMAGLAGDLAVSKREGKAGLISGTKINRVMIFRIIVTAETMIFRIIVTAETN